jgi:hypothetical protein
MRQMNGHCALGAFWHRQSQSDSLDLFRQFDPDPFQRRHRDPLPYSPTLTFAGVLARLFSESFPP